MSCTFANNLQLDLGHYPSPNHQTDDMSKVEPQVTVDWQYSDEAFNTEYEVSDNYHVDDGTCTPAHSPNFGSTQHTSTQTAAEGTCCLKSQTTAVGASRPPSPLFFPLRPAVFETRPTTPRVVSNPLDTGVHTKFSFDVYSHGVLGVKLADISTQESDGELRVDLQTLRYFVDGADDCICPHVPGPTVRVAEFGRAWPDAGLTLPGYPVRKTAGSCFIFAELVQSVSEHFLSWWTCELRNNSSGGSPSKSPYAPGTVQLDQVFLVALRPRHIALGVYEWLPEIELRL